MKALLVIILFPCLLFAQLTPKYFSNANNFNSATSTINNKFNKASTNKALTEFQKTDKELDKNKTEQIPNDSIVKQSTRKKKYMLIHQKLYTVGEKALLM